jgi:hypothetical protein
MACWELVVSLFIGRLAISNDLTLEAPESFSLGAVLGDCGMKVVVAFEVKKVNLHVISPIRQLECFAVSLEIE